MSVFTPVSAAELDVWLGNYSLGSSQGLCAIAGGIENTNYFFTTRQGRYVLTLFERLSRPELGFYLDLMDHLAGHGIPCPKPVAARDHTCLGTLNGKPAAVLSYLPGHSVARPSPAHCATLGALLAKTHLAAASFGRRLDNPRGRRWWTGTARQLMPGLAPDQQALLAEELRFQALHRLEDLPQGLVHGDAFRDNVLFDGSQDDAPTGGLIDFYFAGNEALLFDLAVAANDWCTDEADELDPVRTRALLASYHAVRPLAPCEQIAWPAMLRRAALRFWLSRLLDRRLCRPGELTHVKDPGAFAHMLRLRVRRASNVPWI
jgi:homoserine kinase type II